jgi:diphosphate-dependent phosphofructokinase
MTQHKIAMLTAGGLAPCLSAAVAYLIERYDTLAPDAAMIGYRNGYAGLLRGHSVEVTKAARAQAAVLLKHGGTPFGNSRVKLANRKDCEKRGLVKPGEDPLKVAAGQLVKDGVTILHTIGGDDTNTTAADLAAYLAGNGYKLTVVGLPKTVDNDVIPIRQTLGAWTAAEQGARFFENIANETTTSGRMLIVHEIMGRHSGWLTAATAQAWRKRLAELEFLPALGFIARQKDVHAVYIPEAPVAMDAETTRLLKIMDTLDCVNLFVSEAAGADAIVADMEARGETVDRDAFGHVKLDKVNVGEWFGAEMGKRLKAGKVLVQKSGYFARSAAANAQDLALIREMAFLAADCGMGGTSGVIGHDEERGGTLRAIEFARIKGGKHFDPATPWFAELLKEIGQT